MGMIYETLPEDIQERINEAVGKVTDFAGEDLDIIMATLERLNEAKKSIKENLKAEEALRNKEAKEKAIEIAKAYLATLKAGDMITFTYGAGTKQATLPIEKISEKTVQVNYTPDMLSPTSRTPRRNILFDKIIVPADFKVDAA